MPVALATMLDIFEDITTGGKRACLQLDYGTGVARALWIFDPGHPRRAPGEGAAGRAIAAEVDHETSIGRLL